MFDAQLVDRIGWTLIHSLWQITVLAYLVAVGSRFLCHGSARGRYLAGCLGLLAMVVVPGITFTTNRGRELDLDRGERALAPRPALAGERGQEGALPVTMSMGPVESSPRRAADEDLRVAELAKSSDRRSAPSELLATSATAGKNSPSTRLRAVSLVGASRERVAAWLQPVVPSIATLWIVGVLLLTARPLFGLYAIQRLRRVGRTRLDEEIVALVQRLGERMGIGRVVEVTESALLDVPAVLGTARPLLLLPASAITGLTPQQLEAVIAHELAHVRRHDYLVNYLQTLVETLLFYHPMAWWVSRVVRQEREHCCDDMAIAICRDRVAYATGLLRLDEMRSHPPRPALAANGGSLLRRIRRLAGEGQATRSSSAWLASSLVMLLLLCVAGAQFAPLPAKAEENHEPETRPISAQENILVKAYTGDADAPLEGVNPLWAAVSQRRYDQAQRLLAEDPSLVNRYDHEGLAPLHWAAFSGKVEAVKELLELGADVTRGQQQYEGTPLQYAAGQGHVEVCQILLSHDAAVDAVDCFGRTPLMWAVFKNHSDVVELLLDAGANIDAQTTGNPPGLTSGVGSTSLHAAAEKGHVELAVRLLELGADPTIADEAGRLPLEASAELTRLGDWYRPAPYPEIGFAQPRETARVFVHMASHAPAQAEIEASEKQAIVLQQLYQWALEDDVAARPSDHETRDAVWAKARQGVDRLLSERQLARLRQLVIQQRRHQVFLHQALLPELEITDEQREQLLERWHEHLARVDRYSEEPRHAHLGQASYRRFWYQARGILTEKQREKFETMRGPAVEIDAVAARQLASNMHPADDSSLASPLAITIRSPEQVGTAQVGLVEVTVSNVSSRSMKTRLNVAASESLLAMAASPGFQLGESSFAWDVTLEPGESRLFILKYRGIDRDGRAEIRASVDGEGWETTRRVPIRVD